MKLEHRISAREAAQRTTNDEYAWVPGAEDNRWDTRPAAIKAAVKGFAIVADPTVDGLILGLHGDGEVLSSPSAGWMGKEVVYKSPFHELFRPEEHATSWGRNGEFQASNVVVNPEVPEADYEAHGGLIAP